MHTNSQQTRNSRSSHSALDDACDQFITRYAELDPVSAIEWGFPSGAGRLPDFSPNGFDAIADLNRDLVTFVRNQGHREPWTGNDAITAAALEDRLTLEIDMHETGETLRAVNNLASPIQQIRDSFDLIPRESAQDWDAVRQQLCAVPQALAGYQDSLDLAASRGQVAAQRQIALGIQQAEKLAGSSPDSRFQVLLNENADPSPALIDAVEQARNAYGDLARWMRQRLLPMAPATDGVGRERYQLLSSLFVGATVDLPEAYQWGLAELERIDREQRALAEQLYGPGTTTAEATSRLNNDPAYLIEGTDNLRSWMQELADRTIKDLSGTEFDIPEPLTRIECMVNRGDGGIYYTAPTSDFSRPGRMWWSVPPEENVFHTWQERTTVFLEGVPGHHLQIGQAIASQDSLNMWRRLASWNSGHGEGWALYAEALMVELGYQSAPGDLMGVLDGERLRTARVVLDIGVHLGLPRPDGQGIWDAQYAWDFLKANVAMSDGFLRFELDRYLGWPGQAPSYKLGARLWRQLRDDYVASLGSEIASDAARRQFHHQALSLGSLPMTTLRKALLG